MTVFTETIDIPCPICEGDHRHRCSLAVTRDIVVGLMAMDEQPRPVPFTRLFTCPISDKEFQADFVLTDTARDRIEDVTVGEVIDVDTD